VFRLPGLLHPPSILDRLPAAVRALPEQATPADAPDPATAPGEFAASLEGRLNAYWQRAFAAAGRSWRPPNLRLFDQGIQIECFPWVAFEDYPPLYCFVDLTIYLPVPYISDLATSAGDASGRLALAYALAHEWAHHAQHLTGLADVVEQQAVTGTAMQQLSVRYELQADCLAGVWASSVYALGTLDPGQMAQAEDLASQIRDPKGLSVARHGPLPDRHRAFWAGYTTGRPSTCKAP
jgi:predicted metalloprotease